jgi:hypothetical protein
MLIINYRDESRRVTRHATVEDAFTAAVKVITRHWADHAGGEPIPDQSELEAFFEAAGHSFEIRESFNARKAERAIR